MYMHSCPRTHVLHDGKLNIFLKSWYNLKYQLRAGHVAIFYSLIEILIRKNLLYGELTDLAPDLYSNCSLANFSCSLAACLAMASS